ncbi:LysE family translocator [Paraburkholderia sp. J94]|uniref:LysE family translocator n=1 Tax=Paraburkholderia sp. J94 TaxID=2805441 RepID=UPI002AB29E8A|nr:LysE family translocator [Paraburkholderia sp. J94]
MPDKAARRPSSRDWRAVEAARNGHTESSAKPGAKPTPRDRLVEVCKISRSTSVTAPTFNRRPAMPTPATFLTFLAALCLLELSPGPDMMLVLARGVGQGRRTALFTVVGMVFVAGIVQVSMLVLGLATLIHRYPTALNVLRWAGAVYLIWLGVKMLAASASGHTRTKSEAPVSDWKAVRQGALNSLTNPKSLLFMFAFLPQFVDPARGPLWSQFLILGSIQKLTGIVSLGGVAFASGTVGEWLRRYPRLIAWQERFTGVVMIALGVRLFFSGGAPARPVNR